MVEYPPRVIIPADRAAWLTGGPHNVIGNAAPQTTERVIVAHVPFPDHECFARRTYFGRALRESGYSAGFGWQSQLIADSMDGIGLTIDDWWTLNTTTPEDIERTPDRYQEDLTLRTIAHRLQRSIHLLDASASDANENATPMPQIDQTSEITAEAVLRAAISASRAIEVIGEQHANSFQEIVTGLNGELTNARAELADARTALETAHAETEALTRSRSWRLTAPLRSAARLLRRHG
jgi:hypothetical protein